MQIKVTDETIAVKPNPAIYQDLEYYYIDFEDCDDLLVILNTKTGTIKIGERDDYDLGEMVLLKSGQITISW